MAKADPSRDRGAEFQTILDHWRGIRDRSADLLGRVDLLNSESPPDVSKLIDDLNQLARSYLDRKSSWIATDFQDLRSQELTEADVLLGVGRLLRPHAHYTSPLALYQEELQANLMQFHRFACWNHLVFSQQSAILSLGPDAARGQKITESGKKGHAQVYGTEAIKAAKWLGWQQACDRYRAARPEATKADIYRWAARDFDVSTRTIRTRCQISPKQPQKN